MTKQNVIILKNIHVGYFEQKIFEDFSCEIPSSQMVGIVGANGSGKSTLLKAIMGLIPNQSGSIEIFGKTLQEVRNRVAYLPQKDSIDWDFPASVLEVALMGLYKEFGLFGKVTKQHKEKAMLYLEKVGMADKAKKQISELSGGQQQRVFLARAFAQEADLYLLDEPFVGVDVATENLLIDLLKNLVTAEGKTIVMVHHQLSTVSKYFDYLLLLKEGKIVKKGNIEETFTEENIQETYQFIK
ncbi:MAG: metal ABC transporter ATP-binding protein [Raineya sp.]|jgi:manganese/zinc/iron transport system ATP- binding protein|nr:metal ABC transporter ATP-binding protein [Raineya sp.]